MRQILWIICLSLFVVVLSQLIGMTSARAELAPSGGASQRLLQAAVEGNIKSLRQRLKEKANVNFQDENGETALMKAIGQGHETVVEELLKSPVEIDLQDKAGHTALFYAVSMNSARMVRNILAKKPDLKRTYGKNQDNILFEAVRNDSAEVCRLLVKADKSLLTSLNLKNENALFLAAQLGTSTASRYLVSQGMSAKLKNTEGRTAVEIARENQFTETLKELQKSK